MIKLAFWLVEFRLLGPLECVVGGKPVPLGRFQERCLLAVLLAETGHVVSVDRLNELLWDGDPPARARSIVQTHVSRLRARLTAAGGDLSTGVQLSTRGRGYLLSVPDEAVDLHQFRRLIGQARTETDSASCAATLRAALSLWRGPPLADAATGLIKDQICAGLDELRVAATEDWAQIALALGHHRDVVTDLTALTARYPLRERVVGLYMRALYRDGQQARALEVYRETRRRLVDELGIEPAAQLRQLEQDILTHAPSLAASETGTPGARERFGREQPREIASAGRWYGPRSHLTRIIGRDQEMAELIRLLADHRLVTVVGPAGVGKTTLAIHAAERLEGAEAGRHIAVVNLATLRGEADIVLAVGGLLGVTGTDAAEVLAGVERHLARQPHLLLVDNCEHLVGEVAALVRRFLSASPRLVVLATSRQPVGLAEETVWRLEPLRLPADGVVDTEAPAVALFLRRAGEASPSFAPDEAELQAVASVCRRVDGLPLALELAASRLRAIPIGELARQIQDGVSRPGDAIAATIDWSYRLLPPAERRVLARLAVFRESFSETAAERICGDAPLTPGRVGAALSTLVDRSLIQRYEVNGATRYRMLQVIREYAAGRLAELAEPIADRHLAHWLQNAREVVVRPVFEDQLAAWQEYGPDIDNLRTALEHAFATDHAAAVELTALSFDFWLVHDLSLAETDRWIAAASRHLDGCPPRLLCLIRFHAGVLRGTRGDNAGGLRLLRSVVDDMRVHHPAMAHDAEIGAVRFAVRVLDPAALDAAAATYPLVRESTNRYVRLHGVVMATEALVTWGRYAEALALCERDAPVASDLDPHNALRLLAARCLAELGADQVAAAAATDHAIHDILGRPKGIGHLMVPSRAMALYALHTLPPPDAAHEIATLVDVLSERYSPTLAGTYILAVPWAEAERRSGAVDEAARRLAGVFGHGAGVTNYADLLPAVVVAALLAADLGDRAASRKLAASWDVVRRRLGLPAPLGFAAPVADVLGLDPAPPPAPDPSHTWSAEELRDLVTQADTWCSQL